MKETIEEIIRKLLEDLETVQDIESIDNLCDYGLSSVVLISMIMEIEKVFNIKIKDEDLLFDNFYSVRKIMETLNKYGIE